MARNAVQDGDAALCKGGLGNIHHQFVHLLFHNRCPVHYLHGLQHRGIGSKGNGGQVYFGLVSVERLVIRLIADK